MSNLPKVIFIVGQTASGKTQLAVDLAKKFNGAIINADSRQVYKTMDIITAKPSLELKSPHGVYLVDGIEHYLFDVCDPNKTFTLADFKSLAKLAIDRILSQGKLPIVVGGTGLYIWSLVDNLDIPAVMPDDKLRASLEEKPLEELMEMLKKIDPETVEKIDLKNKRRVLRALDVVLSTGESFVKQATKSEPLYDCLQIGLRWDREEIYERINSRIDEQIKNGAIEETKKLLEKYSPTLPSLSTIGYRELSAYLRGESSLEQAVEQFKIDARHYAKRQETWFKRDERIVWIQNNDLSEAVKIIQNFLK